MTTLAFLVLALVAPPAADRQPAASTALVLDRTEVCDASNAAATATPMFVSAIAPRPRGRTCEIINGVSAYLGCKVTEDGESTTYYNCTNNPPPCMDKADCEACDPPGDD